MNQKTSDNGMGNWQPADSTSNFGLTNADPAMQGGAPGARRVRLKDGVPQVDPYPDAANDGFTPIPPSEMGDVSDIMTSDEIVGFENTRPGDNRTLLITDGYQRKTPEQKEKEIVPRAISLVSFIDVVRDVSPSSQTAPAPAQQGNSKKIDPWVDLGDNGITTNLNLNDPKIRQMIKELQITFPSMGFFPGVNDINKVGQEQANEEELQPLREPGDLDKHLVLNHHVEVNTTLYELPLLDQLHQQMHAQGESSDHNPEVIKVANILDPIQETLDPKVWDNPESEEPRFKSSLTAWVKQAIFGTLKNAGYKNPENWIKLIVTGSLTTYQWSENSDLDVSIWVDLNEFPDFQRSEMIKVIIDELDGDIVPGTMHPIQCFVMDVNEIKSPQEIYKTGVRSAFSLDTNEWIVKPERNRSANVRSQFPDFFRKAKQASAKMQILLKYQPQAVKTYWHFLHKRRRDDMRAGMGDYSESNIVYKMLANDGLFDDIEKITGDHIASHQIMSISFEDAIKRAHLINIHLFGYCNGSSCKDVNKMHEQDNHSWCWPSWCNTVKQSHEGGTHQECGNWCKQENVISASTERVPRDEITDSYPSNAMGYPIVYYTEDGGILCPDCANGLNNSEASENNDDPQWNITDGEVLWEDETLDHCSHCNDPLLPAYYTDEQEQEFKTYIKGNLEQRHQAGNHRFCYINPKLHHNSGDHTFCNKSCQNLMQWLKLTDAWENVSE